jgi:hypothetical protein
MTLNQFHKLDEMEQVEALWEYGVHIADRDEGEHKLILYQVDAFYVEVWYHKEYNVVRKYRAFSSTDILGPYLDKLNIKIECK